MSKSPKSRPQFEPVPQNVIEHINFHSHGGIVKLNDGTIMHGKYMNDEVTFNETVAACHVSKDGGKTWSGEQPLNCEMGVCFLIRLQSGDLFAVGKREGRTKGFASVNVPKAPYYASRSKDDGKNWSKPVEIPLYRDVIPYSPPIQLSTGRLLLSGYWESRHMDCFSPDLKDITLPRVGVWKGLQLRRGGHRSPSMGICKVYFSDDEGQNWEECRGGLFGWFNEQGDVDGMCNITDVYEPTIVETKKGSVLMFARCKRGRLLQSYSLDGGETWLSMTPTELASSPSPACLRRIRGEGDLLCVWNQESGEEIRRGLIRGRLSSAISRDSGMTWSNFKTIESCEGIAEMGRVPVEYPITMNARGRTSLGPIPDGVASFDYPMMDIIDDKVFLRYARQWPEITNADKGVDNTMARMFEQTTDMPVTMTGEGVLRIYPLDWFYH